MTTPSDKGVDYGQEAFERLPWWRKLCFYIAGPGAAMDWMRLQRLQAEREIYRAALSYIERPTMALPSGVDPFDFALNGATETDVRRALATCINTASKALKPPRSGRDQDG